MATIPKAQLDRRLNIQDLWESVIVSLSISEGSKRGFQYLWLNTQIKIFCLDGLGHDTFGLFSSMRITEITHALSSLLMVDSKRNFWLLMESMTGTVLLQRIRRRELLERNGEKSRELPRPGRRGSSH